MGLNDYISMKLLFSTLVKSAINQWKNWNKYFKLRGCLHVKFHPRMKSSLPMVKCLLLFTRFCRDEISSRDERQGWDFIPGWKKEKKMCKHFIPGWNFKMSMFLINLWRMYSNMLSKVKEWGQQVKNQKRKNILFLLFSLWSSFLH